MNHYAWGFQSGAVLGGVFGFMIGGVIALAIFH